MKKEQFVICGIHELPKFIENFTPTHVITLSRRGMPTQEAVKVVELFDYPIIHHIEHFDDVDALDKKYYENSEGYREIELTFPDFSHIKRVKELSDETFNDGSMVVVHCSAGISRSTAMTLGLLVYNGIDKLEAFGYVTEIRPTHYMNSLVLKHWDTILDFDKTDGLIYLNNEWNKFIKDNSFSHKHSGEVIDQFIESKK